MITFQDWDQFFFAVIITIVPFAFGALGLLVKKAFELIKTQTEHVKNEAVRNALLSAESEAETIVSHVVASTNQTVVSDLKAQNGNTLSPADAVKIKNDALVNIRSLLTQDAKTVLSNSRNLDQYLETLLEAEVLRQKK